MIKLKNFFGIIPIMLIILSIFSTAFASTHSTSYNFRVSVKGETRSYDGTDLTFISPKATSTPGIHSINKTYNVALYRDSFIDDYIGNVTLYRDNYGEAKWSNVGSGKYYVFLSKANDEVTLVDNNVTIKN